MELDNRDIIAQSLHGSMRVLDKYNSQPHITVHPSHVDLATQASYQTMDINFVGLIFSVFNYDPNTGIDSKEVAAFQSVKGEGGMNIYRNIPLSVRSDGGRMARTVLGALASGQCAGHTQGGGNGRVQ